MKKLISLVIIQIFACIFAFGATIVVTNTNSSGPGSLYQAFLTANSNSDSSNYITFSSQLSYPITINVTSELPVTKGNLTVDGLVSGADSYPDVILRGNGSNIGIKINYSFDTQIENVVIKGFVFNNFDRGILIYNASNNLIEYCYFGTDVTGSVSNAGQGHPNHGAVMIVDNSSYNTVRNCLMSGNYDAIGIFEPIPPDYNIPGLCTGNVIAGNIIGLDRTGQYAIPNFDGILLINGIRSTLIGGPNPEDRNIISGNTNDAVRFEKLTEYDTRDNQVTGNYIGLNINGSAVIGNGAHGIAFFGASNNTASNNVIAGSGSGGIICLMQGSIENTISGNIIGLMPDGITPAPNNAGINISEYSHYTHITGNIISSNSQYGIRLTADYCNVKSNIIGLAADQDTPRGNGTHGIYISGGMYNIIGGLYLAGGNTISSNNECGIVMTNNSYNGKVSHANQVRGNRIGTNSAGNQPRGNGTDGILIVDGSNHNTIGGLNNNYRNIISGNLHNGIRLGSSLTIGNYIQANRIGCGDDINIVIGNGQDGIRLQNGASHNLIGDQNNHVHLNIIRFNQGNGVTVGTWPTDTSTLFNTIRGNSIAANGLLGIDLGNNGVTHNDPGNYGNGPNKMITWPVFGKQALNTISGSARANCIVDIYITDRPFPWEYGQGLQYIGTTTSDSQGRFLFTIPPEIFWGVAPLIITATTTDYDGNTSEFSKNRRIMQKQ